MTKPNEPTWESLISGRPEQVRAIKSECPLTVVSAGAGTGKTHTLSQRFAWILSQHPDCAVDEILVLTFTEKAAREMQERIAATVEKWYKEKKTELPHLEASVQRMGDAYISTIHAFAMKVIRESALALDIDPTASIVPEPKEDLWWENYAFALNALSTEPVSYLLDEIWRARADELFSSEKFVDLVNVYSPAALADASKNACGTLGSAGFTAEDLWNWPETGLASDIASMEAWFYEIWDLWMRDILPSVVDALREQSDKNFPSNLLFVYEKHRDGEPNLENMRAFAEDLLRQGLSYLGDGKKDTKKIITDALQEKKLGDWRDDAVQNLLKATPPTDEERELSCFLNRVSALGWQCWDNLRRRENLLSMNDLIAYAAEVIKKEPAYAQKFKYILIDEFQDTDELQNDMIKSLWTGENKLFLVGDLKQSIYRFRHANPLIFQKYIDMAKNSESFCYIALDRSFRTKGELLSSFNGIFSEIWRDGLEAGTDMSYEMLAGPDDEAWWAERNSPESQPELEHLLSVPFKVTDENGEDTDKDEKIAPVRKRLFKELARRFKEMHEAGEQIWDKSGDKPGHRAVKWSDFAVLVPTRTSYGVVEEAFTEAGVPFVLCTSKNYFGRGEVKDVTNLLCLLGEPENPLYLAGWIASPMSCVPAGTAEELLRMSAEKTKNARALPDLVESALPEVCANILRLKKIAELEGPSSAILELLKTQDFLKFYEPDARRNVLMNLSYMAGIASEYERSEGVSLSGFAVYLQMIADAQQQKEEPDVSDETQDAVQVLTVHASKGLEYPVVAVLCDEGGNRGAQSIFVSPRYGVLAKKIPAATAEQEKEKMTTVGVWYQENEDRKAQAEQERLWYVALTRTRDKLFLCGTAKRGKEGKINFDKKGVFLERALAALQVDPNGIVLPPEEKGVGERKVRTGETPSEILKLSVVSPAALGRLSASAYAMLSWCPNAYRIAYRQGRNLAWTVKSGESSGGADFGSLAHWILARWDFDVQSLSAWLPDQESELFKTVLRLPPLIRGEFRRAGVRREMAAMLTAFAHTETAQKLRMLASEENKDVLMRETPFRVQDGNLLLVGSIDLYYEDADGIHVRDWKTTDELFAPSEYYDAQLDFYAYAIARYREQKKLPALPLDKAIVYLRPGEKQSSITHLAESDVEKIGLCVHEASQIALLGEFSKQLNKCNRCPWRQDCMKN